MLPCTPCLTAGRVPPPPPLTCNVRLRSPERKTVSSAEGSVEGASVALAGVEATALAALAQLSARWSTVAISDQGASMEPFLLELLELLPSEEAAGRMGMRSREAGCGQRRQDNEASKKSGLQQIVSERQMQCTAVCGKRKSTAEGSARLKGQSLPTHLQEIHIQCLYPNVQWLARCERLP